MAQKIRLLHAANGTATPPTLDEGELALNALADPPQLWTGVPTSRDPSGRIDLLDGTDPFTLFAPLHNPSGGQNNYLPVNNPAYTGSLTGSPWILGGYSFDGTTWRATDVCATAIRQRRTGDTALLELVTSTDLTVGQTVTPTIAFQAHIGAADRLYTSLFGYTISLNGSLVVSGVANFNGGYTNFNAGVVNISHAGNPLLRMQNSGTNVPNILGSTIEAGWPVHSFTTSAAWTGGGPQTHQLGWSNSRQNVGNDGFYVEARYRDFDTTLVTAGNPTGRRQQLWMGRDTGTWLAGTTPTDPGTLITTGPGRTVGLLLDGVTGTITASGSMVLAADATQPLEAVPLQQLTAGYLPLTGGTLQNPGNLIIAGGALAINDACAIENGVANFSWSNMTVGGIGGLRTLTVNAESQFNYDVQINTPTNYEPIFSVSRKDSLGVRIDTPLSISGATGDVAIGNRLLLAADATQPLEAVPLRQLQASHNGGDF